MLARQVCSRLATVGGRMCAVVLTRPLLNELEAHDARRVFFNARRKHRRNPEFRQLVLLHAFLITCAFRVSKELHAAINCLRRTFIRIREKLQFLVV
jgi:hypothetical protein